MGISGAGFFERAGVVVRLLVVVVLRLAVVRRRRPGMGLPRPGHGKRRCRRNV
jgi:hypothetical protein